MADVTVGTIIGPIGLIPPTLALMRFWIRFTGDTRRFGEDSAKYRLRMEALELGYESLRHVLFDENRFPFAKTLYGELPRRSQEVIFSMLKELPRLLYEYHMVEVSLGFSSPEQNWTNADEPDPEIASELTSIEIQQIFDDDRVPEAKPKSSVFSFRHLWWAARTKKRVQDLLDEVEDWYFRIKHTVEIYLWPAQFAEKFRNLKVLEDDAACQKTGIAHFAGLRKLLLSDTPEPSQDFQLESNLRVETFDNSLRGLSYLKKTPLRPDTRVYVEALRYQPDKEGFLDEKLKQRFQEIASLLNYANDADFRVLHCRNFAESREPYPEYLLIFDLPEPKCEKPISLDSIIASSAGRKPSLDARFRLCYKLAQSLSLLHSVNWIHRSIRSENILFFNDAALEGDLEEPYLCGFEACRLENDLSTGPWDDKPGRNGYRHPDRWGIPKKLFTKHHDIYGKLSQHVNTSSLR